MVPFLNATPEKSTRFEKLWPLLAALVAAGASAPALWLPFLSDDWAQIQAVARSCPLTTPFHDFRPLFMASLWLDRHLWGLAPAWFHATNVLLIAACAALVVIVIRRFTRDPMMAIWAGVLFALHPFHVENAAWVAARSDPLFALPFLLALLAYDRWRKRANAVPILALFLFELALLAKETAVTLPLVVVLIGALDINRRPQRREWIRGYGALFAVAAVHFVFLRTWALGGLGRTLASSFGVAWIKNGLGFALAAIIPLDAEILVAHPISSAAIGALVFALLVLIVWFRARRLPRLAVAGGLVFAALLLPYLVSFQERYIFLPVAAASLSLAAAVRATRGTVAVVLSVLLGAGWIGGCAAQWADWREAAGASRTLVDDLVRESATEGLQEIVIANMPYAVRGGSVAGDLGAAIALSGGRPVRVRAAAYVSYPSATADALEGAPTMMRVGETVYAELRLRIPGGSFSRFVGPRPPAGAIETVSSGCTLVLTPGGSLTVRVPEDLDAGRAVYVWNRGRLSPLFHSRG